MESVEIAVVDYGRKLLQADKINFRTLDLAVGVLIAVNTIAASNQDTKAFTHIIYINLFHMIYDITYI